MSPPRHHRGLTLIELILATALLAAAAIPVIEALGRGTAIVSDISHHTQATLLARKELARVTATATEDFQADLATAGRDLGGGYLAAVEQDRDGLTQDLVVRVGWDVNGNGDLAPSEVLTTMTTRIANTGTTSGA